MWLALMIASALAEPKCSDQYFTKTSARASFEAPRVCSEIMRPGRDIYNKFADGSTLAGGALLIDLQTSGPPTEKSFNRMNKYSMETQPSPAQYKSVVKLVKDLRDATINAVIGDVPASQINATEAVIQSRLSKLTSYVGDTKGHCADTNPNAYYDYTDNSLHVCQSIINYPIEALIPILAHELDHAIDLCGLVVLNVNQNKLKVDLDDKQLKQLKSCGMSESYIERHYEDLTTIAGAKSISPLSEAAPALLACQYLTSSVKHPYSVAQSPFFSLQRCTDEVGAPSLQTRLDENVKSAQRELTQSDSSIMVGKIIDPLGAHLTCTNKAKGLSRITLEPS